MKRNFYFLSLSVVFTFFYFDTFCQSETYKNPILPRGADPYSTFYEGFYYYANAAGGNRLELRKTPNLALLKDPEQVTIWTAPANTMYSKEVWAPEIHHINNKWYVYFAADDGDNNNHRMYVLENEASDPMKGEWVFKGKVAADTDRWAIDGHVFRHDDQLYMVWSGWEADTNGRQDIYLAKMKDPLTIAGERVKISSPRYLWERQWKGGPEVYVNEGPQYLSRNGKTFIVYSASGCWTDHYSLGILELEDENLLDEKSWIKHPEPIFKTSVENGVFGPGHNSFFTSPDGSEDWVLYHANENSGDGCGGKRSPRMQKISWNEDGRPHLGIPVSVTTQIPIPGN